MAIVLYQDTNDNLLFNLLYCQVYKKSLWIILLKTGFNKIIFIFRKDIEKNLIKL